MPEKLEKLLSIYIPTYNRKKYLSHQLKYLKKEMEAIDPSDVEVIICDNHSDDGTEEIALGLIADTDFKYYRNDRNLGIKGNAYKSTDYTSGKYLWIMSDDDYLRRGTVKHVIDTLKEYPDLGYMYLNYTHIDMGNTPMWRIPFKQFYYEDGFTELINKYPPGLAMVILTSSCIYLRKAVIKAEEVLKLDEIESYSLNFFSSLTGMRMGTTYFDRRIWVKTGNEVSWGDIVYESHTGWRRSVLRLSQVGYSKTEIRKINHYLLKGSWFEDCRKKYEETGDKKRLLNDFWYFASHAPENIPSILFYRPYVKVRKIASYAKHEVFKL